MRYFFCQRKNVQFYRKFTSSVHRFAAFLTFALAIPFATSIRVTCTFQRGNLETWLPNAYICDVQSLTVESPDGVIEGIDGNHLPGHSNVNVTALRIQNQNCFFVPSGFANFFPNLEGLTISSSGLRRISRDDLSPFPNLLTLALNGNRLISLENGLFEGVPLLRTAGFGNNRPRAIPASLLDPLFLFTFINLDNNVCINAPGTTFPTPTLNMIMREVMESCQNFATLENEGTSEIESLRKGLIERLLNLQSTSS